MQFVASQLPTKYTTHKNRRKPLGGLKICVNIFISVIISVLTQKVKSEI